MLGGCNRRHGLWRNEGVSGDVRGHVGADIGAGLGLSVGVGICVDMDIPNGVRGPATCLWTIDLGSRSSIPIQPSTTMYAPEYVINNAYTQKSLP